MPGSSHVLTLLRGAAIVLACSAVVVAAPLSVAAASVTAASSPAPTAVARWSSAMDAMSTASDTGPTSMPGMTDGSMPGMTMKATPGAGPRAEAHSHGADVPDPSASRAPMAGMDGMSGMADMPGMEHGHSATASAVSPSRPRALLLGGFGLLNLVVLVTAAILRRRGLGERGRGRSRRAMATG